MPNLKDYLIGKPTHPKNSTNLFNASSSATNFMLNYLEGLGLRKNNFKNDPWKAWSERRRKEGKSLT